MKRGIKVKKRILSIFFCLLFVFSVFPLSIFASETESESVIPHKDLSKTTIEYDFENVFYGKFELKDYKSNRYKDFEFIAGTETFVDGYSNFYIYLYNPNQKIINISSEKNTLNFAYYSRVKGILDIPNVSENDFNKMSLSFICSYGATSESESFSNGTILKFKVGEGLLNVEAAKETINRHYKLADIELLIEGNDNATSFIIGKHYEIMNKEGYTYSYDTDLATLEIDAYHTFYRTKTEDIDTYVDIQSVYFPVPKDYENLYGSLYSMKIDYTVEKYNPILLCQDTYIANAFMSQYIDNDKAPALNNSNFKWSVVFDKFTWNAGDLLCDGWNKVYNLSSLEPYIDLIWHNDELFVRNFYNFEGIVEMPLYPDVAIPVNSSDDIPLRLAIQYTGDFAPENVAISGEDLLPQINAVRNDSYFKISSKRYVNTITVNDTPGTFNKYKICSGWKNFWNLGFYNEAGEEMSIEPFKKINLEDLNTLDKQSFSENYLVDINDIECTTNCGKCITCATSNEKYANCDWYLLRYEQTDFKSWDAVLIDNTTGYYYKDEHKACVIQTDVIRNFDTISLTFKEKTEDGNFYQTFPIGRTPTDFVADATFPSEKPNVELPSNYDEWKELVDKIITILKIVIIVFAVILVLRIVSFVSPIFEPLKKLKRKENNNEKKNN